MFSYGNMFLKSLVLVFLLGLSYAHGPIFNYKQNTGLKVVKPMPRASLVVDSNRKNCSGGLPDGDQPPNRANTSAIVNTLLQGMSDRYYSAYIVPTSDEHQSEYVADADKRREYVSGFTGSAGTAVILSDGQRALWTDGRYFLQADDQLDCNWILMRSGNDGVPTIAQWLISELGPGSIVSIDARLIGYDTWLSFSEDLSAHDIVLYPDQILDGNNLVDLQWNEDGRPAYSLDPIFTLAVEYTGREWYDKIFDIKEKMDSNDGDVIVLTTLDEIAWTLNLRGSDIPFNPVFRSYLIIDKGNETSPSVSFFVPDIDVKVPQEVLDELGVGNCVAEKPCVTIKPYNDIGTELSEISERNSTRRVLIPEEFSTSDGSSYYIYNIVPEEKRVPIASPPLLMKASKNEVERNGMKNAHIRDAVALISFLAFLENEITSGEVWTEVSAQILLDEYRANQSLSMGPSFATISGFGSNGAIIHYEATEETDVRITNESLYLLDSGGQYLDGTTDVTRTMHYGTPSADQIEAYTRVLKGVIDFGTVVIPTNFGKSDTDILARRSLYSQGLDYRHGTSHGVGCFLNVHEASDVVYENGFHGSDEPGFYLDGSWGIRIENVIAASNVTTKYNFVDVSLGFETITLVPLEPKLIDVTLLTKDQCNYLNSYYARIRDIVGPELLNQNQQQAYDWMISKTEEVDCSSS
ncbi:UNVERIFIED_CONTAM: hypothetical protein RMT77_003236 [Armadillidium vulgare]